MATGAGLRPSRAQMRSSCSGFRWPKVPTAPESLPTRMSSAAASKRIEIALHLGIPVEQLEAEGRGLGVDAVGAADGGRVLELDGAALEHGEKADNAFANQRRCFFDLQRLGRIDNVVRREPVVQPAGLGRPGLGL